MNRPADRPVDQFGFPIPITAGPTPRQADEPRRPRRRVSRWFLWMLALAFLGAGGYSLLRSPLFADARKHVAEAVVENALHALWHEDDPDGAMSNLGVAVFLAPDMHKAYICRADIRIETGDLDGALRDANEAVAVAGNEPRVYEFRSYVYQCKQMFDAAIADAKKALELPTVDRPRALNNLAYARALGNVELEAALADVETSLRADPRNPAYLDTRGYLEHLLGRHDQAIEDLKLAIDIYEWKLDREEARFSNFEGSKAYERRRREAEKFKAPLYYHRGLAYQAQGLHDHAQVDLQRAAIFGYNPALGVQ